MLPTPTRGQKRIAEAGFAIRSARPDEPHGGWQQARKAPANTWVIPLNFRRLYGKQLVFNQVPTQPIRSYSPGAFARAASRCPPTAPRKRTDFFAFPQAYIPPDFIKSAGRRRKCHARRQKRSRCYLRLRPVAAHLVLHLPDEAAHARPARGPRCGGSKSAACRWAPRTAAWAAPPRSRQSRPVAAASARLARCPAPAARQW